MSTEIDKSLRKEPWFAGKTTESKVVNNYIKPEFGDRARDYQTEEYNGKTILAHKENGDCIYLEESGCSIHGQQPYVCRTMDCRRLLSIPRLRKEKLLKMGLLKPELFEAAKKISQ